MPPAASSPLGTSTRSSLWSSSTLAGISPGGEPGGGRGTSGLIPIGGVGIDPIIIDPIGIIDAIGDLGIDPIGVAPICIWESMSCVCSCICIWYWCWASISGRLICFGVCCAYLARWVGEWFEGGMWECKFLLLFWFVGVVYGGVGVGG